MNPQIEISNEQINSLPLLLGIMKELGIREKIDDLIQAHGQWEGISPGTLVTIWLSYMLMEKDHRLVQLRAWAGERQQTINTILQIKLRETDCSDDRLAILLTMLGQSDKQAQIDEAMLGQWMRVYSLPAKTVRLDSTSVSVYHEQGEADSLIQFGYSKDHRPDLKQFKAMMATLDPLGMPLVCHMVAGNKGDEGLYIPAYDAVVKNLDRRDLLFIGDSKMGTIATRSHIVQGGSRYLCAYRPGNATAEINGWIDEALANAEQWQMIEGLDEHGQIEIKGAVYEWERTLTSADKSKSWQERVLMVWSAAYQRGLLSHRETALKRLTVELEKLRLEPKQGRKRYGSQAEIEQLITNLIAKAKLEKIVHTSVETRQRQGKAYWLLSSISVDIEAWRDMVKRLGWQVHLTNTSVEDYRAAQLVSVYNKQVIEERGFSRLKTRNLQIRPIFLRDEKRIGALLWLLTMALRILTLVEYRLRQALAKRNQALIGLNPASRTQSTLVPTTERVISAFANITLTTIRGQGIFLRQVSALNATQSHILSLLDLPPDLFQQLNEGVANLLPHLPES